MEHLCNTCYWGDMREEMRDLRGWTLFLAGWCGGWHVRGGGIEPTRMCLCLFFVGGAVVAIMEFPRLVNLQ